MAIINISTRLEPDIREKALARIGYFVNTVKHGRHVDYRRLLVWFVELPGKNADSRSLREEVRALQEEGSGGTSLGEDDASTAAHLPNTQRRVAQYFEQLTQTGRIEFEEFKISPSVFLPRFRKLSNFPHSIVSSEPVEPFNGKGLLYLFYLALKGEGDRLRQCQFCGILFVQTRRKQRFCKPQHQQVASMRDLRARQLKEREARKTNRRLRLKKGAKSHGLKKYR